MAFTLLVAAIGALLLILWPRLKWAHGLDPEVLCNHHLRVDVGDEQVLESLFDSLVKQCAKNDGEFKKLYLYYRAAIGLLFLGTDLRIPLRIRWPAPEGVCAGQAGSLSHELKSLGVGGRDDLGRLTPSRVPAA